MTYPMTADSGPDDLPRTLRREKEAREREARERQAADRAQDVRETLPMGSGAGGDRLTATVADSGIDRGIYAVPDPGFIPVAEPLMPASVQRIDVPFKDLVLFFLKAVIAAIPALIALTVIMWVGGQILKFLFPWLVKAQILIHFPN